MGLDEGAPAAPAPGRDRASEEARGFEDPGSAGGPGGGACGFAEGSAEGAGRLSAGRNRALQSARRGRRKLFGGKAKRRFLEYFAATANAKWSAERAGVAYQTVWKHRMKDPGFASGYDRALDQALARLRAKLVETRIAAKPIPIDGDWEVPELQEVDPRIGLQILREQGWGLSGPDPAGRPRKSGRAPSAASNAQVRSELEKRLLAYARRMRAAGREPPPWLPPPPPPPPARPSGPKAAGKSEP